MKPSGVPFHILALYLCCLQIREALEHMPALLVLEDLDVLCPAESAGADGAATSADPALVAWLCDLLDHLAEPSPEWGRLPLVQPQVAAADGTSKSGGIGSGSGDGQLAGAHLGAALWPPRRLR